MTRVHSSDVTQCGDDAFYNLSVAMNKREEKVQVRARDLDELVNCHIRFGASAPKALVFQTGKGRIEVDRMTLFNFIVDHGEMCGTRVSPDWQSSRQRRDMRFAMRRAS